jgi:hypothetical protein
MSEIKHTPGPWILDDADNHAYFIDHDYHFIDAGNGFLGSDGSGFSLSGCMSESDARLIAAAPELLAALIRARVYVGMVTEFDKDDPIFSAIDAIDAAIAKATGSQS